MSWIRLALAAALAIATLQNWANPLQLKLGAELIAFLIGIAVLPGFIRIAWPSLRTWARSAAFVLLAALIPLGIVEVSELGYIYGHP